MSGRRITQTCGNVRIDVHTGGHPLWPEIEIDTQSGQGVVNARVDVSYLHDLRYCIDRVLSQIDAGERAHR